MVPFSVTPSKPGPGCLKPQIGWGFEQPDLVKDVPAHGRRVGMRRSLKVLFNPDHSVIVLLILPYQFCWKYLSYHPGKT